jgi:hypothetical protein
MAYTRETASERAKTDLAARLGIDAGAISIANVSDREFPDMSLGAAVDGEMSAQMISSGWRISLEAGGKTYEYRADKYQLRLHNFDGKNYLVNG